MHYKSLIILIKRRLCKFFLVNKFDLGGDWWGFFNGVSSPSQLFLSKLDVNIIKNLKKHTWKYFYANISQSKILLKKLRTTEVIKELEGGNDNAKGL